MASADGGGAVSTATAGPAASASTTAAALLARTSPSLVLNRTGRVSAPTLHVGRTREVPPTRVATIMLAWVALLLGGCGGNTDAPPADVSAGSIQTDTSSAPDPCSLLTDDEVSQDIGVRVTEKSGPRDDGLSGWTECRWTLEGDQSLTVVSRTESAAAVHESGADRAGAEKVDGLGDDAYYELPVMSVLADGVGLQLLYSSYAQEDTTREFLTALAHKAVGRL